MEKQIKKPGRRTIRLQHYNYSQEGMYFVTICTHEKICHFGAISNEQMHLNALGKIVEAYWKEIPEHFEHVDIDEFVIMPNHVHGILSITDSSKQKVLLGTIVRSFKAIVTRWARRHVDITIVWQRNYYEHIIRNQEDYQRIGEYILANPLQWDQDTMHPNNAHHDPLLIENPC